MPIQIDLTPGRRQRRRAGLKMPDFSGFAQNIKQPWLFVAVAGWLGVVAFAGLTYYRQESALGGLEDQLNAKRSEHRRFNVFLAQQRRATRDRDTLEAELKVIREIDSDRYVWPHVLDQIAKALPDFTWVTEIAEMPAPPDTGITQVRPGIQLTISGQTVDVQALTSFVRQLQSSPWLENVEGNNFSTSFTEDRPLTTFNITARYREADSAFIRTVPLRQSVR